MDTTGPTTGRSSPAGFINSAGGAKDLDEAITDFMDMLATITEDTGAPSASIAIKKLRALLGKQVEQVSVAVDEMA